MAIEFIDGFDHYHTYFTQMKWGNPPSSSSYFWSPSGGRRNSGFASLGICELRKTIQAIENVVVGIAVRFNGDQQAFVVPFLRLYAYFDLQMYVALGIGGHLEIHNGDGTLLGAGTTIIERDRWYFIELKAHINTSGTAILRIDEASELSLSGVNTAHGGYYYTNKIAICNIANPPMVSFDDLYICNLYDTMNNNFLGDSRVDVLYPTQPGTFTEWTPSTPPNWECVNDPSFDNGANYIAAIAVAAETDSYLLSAYPAPLRRIFGLQMNMFALSGFPGGYTHVFKPVIYISGTPYYSPGSYWSSPVYSDSLYVSERNPRTAKNWTHAKLAASEFGVYCIQVPSNSYLRIAQFVVEVLSSCNTEEPAEGWPHNFIGVLNESIAGVNTVTKDLIHAVNGVE